MKKLFTIIALLFCTTSAQGNSCTIVVEELQFSKTGLAMHEGKALNGVVCIYRHVDAILREDGDGNLVDVDISDYGINVFVVSDDGYDWIRGSFFAPDLVVLYQEIPYKNGEIDGIIKIYDVDGELTSEIPYKNGEKN